MWLKIWGWIKQGWWAIIIALAGVIAWITKDEILNVIGKWFIGKDPEIPKPVVLENHVETNQQEVSNANQNTDNQSRDNLVDDLNSKYR
jgi:hypothetical protein